MSNAIKKDSARTWLEFADLQDFENTWSSASSIFQSAIEIDDWRKSLRAARRPLGSVKKL